MALSKY